MAQEEQHIVSSSHSGGGGGGADSGGSDRSRNVKRKKIPQRGLGVAQLEKIRVEEQRKKALEAANALANNASLSPSPVNFRSPNTMYRLSPPSVPSVNGGAEDAASWCRLWSGDHNHRNAAAAGFRPPVNLQAESNDALPLLQRFSRFQQPASPVVSPSSPSAVEPPSNQNMHCNSYASSSSSWPEEYKMVGVKRPYPFSLESPPARSFTVHFDPASVVSRSRGDELPSCGSGYAAQSEPRNTYMRDGPSNPPEQSSRRALRDDGRLNGDFLTLAPPAAAALPPSTQGPEVSDHECSAYCSVSRDSSVHVSSPLHWRDDETRRVHDSGASGSREEPFSFFPVRSDESGGEKGEAIDLNLKL